MNFWKKKIKNTAELSKATGIEEEKIKELKEGKREIGGETMEKILNAINETNKKTELEKRVEQENVMQWIKNTDIKELIKNFGYKNYNDCAKKIGIAPSSLCTIINGKFKDYSNNIQKIYDFFHDDFNKKVDDDKVDDKIISKKEKLPRFVGNKNEKVKFLNKFTLRELTEKLGFKSQPEFANAVGLSYATLKNIFNNNIKTDSLAVVKTYDYVQQHLKGEIDLPKVEESDYKNETKKLDYLKQFTLVDLKSKLGYTATTTFAKAIGVSKGSIENVWNGNTKYDTNVIKKIYEFVVKKLENVDIPVKQVETPQILTKEENNINILEDTQTEENEAITDKIDYDDKERTKADIDRLIIRDLRKKNKTLIKTLKRLTKEYDDINNKLVQKNLKLEDLENRIRRYEILIDRLK